MANQNPNQPDKGTEQEKDKDTQSNPGTQKPNTEKPGTQQNPTPQPPQTPQNPNEGR